jgi:hypothetical protein
MHQSCRILSRSCAGPTRDGSFGAGHANALGLGIGIRIRINSGRIKLSAVISKASFRLPKTSRQALAAALFLALFSFDQ